MGVLVETGSTASDDVPVRGDYNGLSTVDVPGADHKAVYLRSRVGAEGERVIVDNRGSDDRPCFVYSRSRWNNE